VRLFHFSTINNFIYVLLAGLGVVCWASLTAGWARRVDGDDDDMKVSLYFLRLLQHLSSFHLSFAALSNNGSSSNRFPI